MGKSKNGTNYSGDWRGLFEEMISRIHEMELGLAREHSLGPEEYLALHLLSFSGEMNMGELRRRLSVPRSTLTFMIDSLEKRGLVVRQQSPADRRSFLLRLTPAGRRTLASILAEKRRLLTPTFEKLRGSVGKEVDLFLAEIISLLRGDQTLETTQAPRAGAFGGPVTSQALENPATAEPPENPVTSQAALAATSEALTNPGETSQGKRGLRNKSGISNTTATRIAREDLEARRESWRRFDEWEASHKKWLGPAEQLTQAGEMAEFFLKRHPAYGKDEKAIRDTASGVQQMHESLKRAHLYSRTGQRSEQRTEQRRNPPTGQR